MKKSLLIIMSLLLSGAWLSAQNVILDFEDGGSSTLFQYFGSSLEPGTNSIIDNPDPSGINTSAKVADFTKPTGAMTWAGAFGVDPVTTDLTSDNQICVKVWFNEPGNLALKLEQGDQADWIRQIDVTEAQTWVEVCFDANQPSIEAPFETATGGTYQGLVLFFDFGESPAEDRSYFFDDVVTQQGTSAPVDITFSVDMNEYEGSFTTVYVAGTFNDFSDSANPLADDDGDGVWTGTVTGIPVGSHEYLYHVDNFADAESFSGTETCTVTDPSGQFTNRVLSADASQTLPTVCYESCFACGESITITINLGEGGISPSDDGFFIAGGGNFGNPGDFPLTDDDGDGVHTISFERPIGFESYYTFTNGNCPDYSCKENIAGQDCANPDNFNDRFMGPFNEDTVINTCFAQCTTTTDCASGPQNGNITFQVDMSEFGGDFMTVFAAGTFNNFSENANPLADDDGDGIWEATIPLNGGTYEYKFQLDMWAQQEEFADGDPCTVTDPSGVFINRLLEVDGDATFCFIYNSCTACDGNNVFGVEVDDQIFTVQPSLVRDFTLLQFGESQNAAKDVRVINTVGQVVFTDRLIGAEPQYRFDASQLENGLYFITVETNGKIQTRRVVVQH